MNSSPNSPEIRKSNRKSPKIVTWFPERVPSFPKSVPYFPIGLPGFCKTFIFDERGAQFPNCQRKTLALTCAFPFYKSESFKKCRKIVVSYRHLQKKVRKQTHVPSSVYLGLYQGAPVYSSAYLVLYLCALVPSTVYLCASVPSAVTCICT